MKRSCRSSSSIGFGESRKIADLFQVLNYDETDFLFVYYVQLRSNEIG